MVEFALVGIPAILFSISITECSIAAFEFHSLTNAITTAARYAAFHGATCQSPNSCTITIANIATLIANFTWIADPTRLSVTFIDPSGSTTCELSVCKTYTTQYFPSSTSHANAVGNQITIKATYRINNPMPMYWYLGTIAQTDGPSFSSDNTGYVLGAQSVQAIIF
jgi:hypothetical protein